MNNLILYPKYSILGLNVCDSQEAVYRHYDSWIKIANGEEPRKEIRKLFGPGNVNQNFANRNIIYTRLLLIVKILVNNFIFVS